MNAKILSWAVLLGAITGAPLAMAGPAIEQALGNYQSQGAGPFSAAQGEQLWAASHPSAEDGKARNCGTCHGQNLSQGGKHARTGKVIKAMAPSANPESLSDVKKIEKWFKRNCKWTWGRECTAQEKGDLLSYLKAQ